jgi:hypothetical protein
MPRKGMKLVAEQKPPIQWKITPKNGFGPKMPHGSERIGIRVTIVPDEVLMWK